MAKWRRGGGGRRRRWVIEFVPPALVNPEEELPTVNGQRSIVNEGDAGALVEVAPVDVVESGCMADVPGAGLPGLEGHPPCVSDESRA